MVEIVSALKLGNNSYKLAKNPHGDNNISIRSRRSRQSTENRSAL